MEDRRKSVRSSAIPRVSRLPTLRSSASVSSLRPASISEAPLHNPKLRNAPSRDRLSLAGPPAARKTETALRTSRLQTRLPTAPSASPSPISASTSIDSSFSPPAPPTPTPPPAPETDVLFKRRLTLTRRPSEVFKESPITPADASPAEAWGSASMELPPMPKPAEDDGFAQALKPKPTRSRPSLSERTIETLSQLPSSPANRGRPSAFFDTTPSDRSPSRPASRASRTSHGSRPSSSYRNDVSFSSISSSSRPQSRPGSSSRLEDGGLASFRPATGGTGTFKTPLAPINGTPPTQGRANMGVKALRPPSSRIALAGDTMRNPARKLPAPASKTGSLRSRTPSPEKKQELEENKPLSRTMSARPLKARPSLGPGLFKKPSIAALDKTKTAASVPASRKTSLVSQKSSNTSSDDTNRSSTSPTSTVLTVDSTESAAAAASRKSSAALRETIARAKAAKKAAAVKNLDLDSDKCITVARQPVKSPLIPTDTTFDFGLSQPPFGHRQSDTKATTKVIEGRLATARTSGRLNIAALGLREIPHEVTKMYDMESMGAQNGSWAECVDITRFVAADNELEMIEEWVFPDRDPQAWANDDDGQGNIFGGLETLDLHGNMLISLPMGLRRLDFLTSLNMSSNRITNGSFEVISKITSLRDLKLGGNLFYGPLDNSFSQLINLEIVDLHGNNISALPAGIVNLTKLRILNLAENSFESLPFETLSKLPLTELVARKNKLSGVLIEDDVESFPSLQTLDVSSNQLVHITLPSSRTTISMPALHQLCVSMNRLQDLPSLRLCTSLLTLTADENSITAFPDGLTSLNTVKHVDFSSNDLRVVPMEVGCMEGLTMLRLSGNPLRDKKFCSISTHELKDILATRMAPPEPEHVPEGAYDMPVPMAITDDSATIGNATPAPKSSQPAADLADKHSDGSDADDFATPPTSAPQSPAAVRSRSHTLSDQVWVVKNGGVLDRSGTQSSSLHPVVSSRVAAENTVREVQLHHNLFATMPESLSFFAPTLTALSLAHNQLTGETYIAGITLELPALRELNLAANHITSLVPLTTNLISPRLEKLDVGTNRIGALPAGTALRDAFPELTVLLIGNNHLAELEPESIRGLRVVDASNNDIAHLNPRIGLLGDGIGGDGLQRLDVMGNRFRVPRFNVLERGTEATLRFLRGRVPVAEMAAWKESKGVAGGCDDGDGDGDSFYE